MTRQIPQHVPHESIVPDSTYSAFVRSQAPSQAMESQYPRAVSGSCGTYSSTGKETNNTHSKHSSRSFRDGQVGMHRVCSRSLCWLVAEWPDTSVKKSTASLLAVGERRDPAPSRALLGRICARNSPSTPLHSTSGLITYKTTALPSPPDKKAASLLYIQLTASTQTLAPDSPFHAIAALD